MRRMETGENMTQRRTLADRYGDGIFACAITLTMFAVGLMALGIVVVI